MAGECGGKALGRASADSDEVLLLLGISVQLLTLFIYLVSIGDKVVHGWRRETVLSAVA